MVAATLLAFSLAQSPEPDLVAATGSAQRTLVAERAVIGASVQSSEEDRGTAARAVRDLLDRAVAVARKAAPHADFRTPQTTVNFNGNGPSGGFGGGSDGVQANDPRSKAYRGSGYFEVAGVEPADVEPLLKSLAKVDGTNADVARYEVKDAAAARRAILREAFLDAKARAEELAEAAGRKLGGVYLLESKGANFGSRFDSEPTPTGVVRRAIKLVDASASVTVRFRLL